MDGHTIDPGTEPQAIQEPARCLGLVLSQADGWKQDRDLKVIVKGLKTRVADLTKSREQWRTKAEQASQRLADVEAENAEPRAGSLRRRKKNGPEAGPLNLTATESDVPRGQQYAVGVVQWFLTLVLDCGASLRDLVDDARRSHPIALTALRRAGRALGLAIASATVLCDLEVVAIGGGLSQAGPLLFDPLEATLRERVGLEFAKEVRVVPAALGQESGLVGAAALIVHPDRYWAPKD